MARSTLQLQYLGSADSFAVDAMIDYPRKFIRHVFRAYGELYDITSICSVDDLNRNAIINDLTNASRSGGALLGVVVTKGTDDYQGAGAAVEPVEVAVSPDSSGAGVPVLFRFACAATGATGTADDVTLFSSLVPYDMTIVDAWAVLSVAGAGGTTATIRTAAAGAGTQLSGAISTAAAGIARQAGTTPTALTEIAALSSLFLRRTDRSAVLDLFVLALKT